MSLFSRRLEWLYAALRIEDAAIPNRLESRELLPTLDALQGGWGLGGSSFANVPQLASQPAKEIVVVPGDRELNRVVFSGHIRNFTAAAAVSTILLREPLNAGVTLLLWRDNVNPAVNGGFVDWRTLSPGGFWWVPPGWSLRVSAPATGLGDVWDHRFGWVEAPAGFKLW